MNRDILFLHMKSELYQLFYLFFCIITKQFSFRWQQRVNVLLRNFDVECVLLFIMYFYIIGDNNICADDVRLIFTRSESPSTACSILSLLDNPE